jgi:hypothetical protein
MRATDAHDQGRQRTRCPIFRRGLTMVDEHGRAGAHLKTAEGASSPWVRIPPPPRDVSSFRRPSARRDPQGRPARRSTPRSAARSANQDTLADHDPSRAGHLMRDLAATIGLAHRHHGTRHGNHLFVPSRTRSPFTEGTASLNEFRSLLRIQRRWPPKPPTRMLPAAGEDERASIRSHPDLRTSV